MNKRILCIDDIPGEMIDEATLEQTIRSMFKGKYELLFETDPRKAYEIIREDKSIKLVFLDIDFGGEPLGPQIADILKSINPDLKIIVLTSINRHGEKIRFGKKINVKKYVTKRELYDDIVKVRLTNLAECLIEDPENKNWTILVDDENETITLENFRTSFKRTFNIPSKSRQKTIALLCACSAKPNVCVKSIEMDGFIDDPRIGVDKYVNEVVYETNTAVREATEWMTWGILDSLSCGSSEAKLVIGNVEKLDQKEELSSPSIDKHYLELKKKNDELERRLRKIEEILKI